ncbi:MAG TPA: hypothetical protein VLF71_01390 [Candidatus Saccharimonadales bacterium]|nr:hypothetical protein [Candidatus Saccharimonadales bacterium]
MDSENKPTDSANKPASPVSGAGSTDESDDAAILDAAAASKLAASAGGGTAAGGSDVAPANDAGPDAAPADVAEPAEPASPTAPTDAPSTSSEASSPVPDSPTPNMADSSSVLGAAPAPAGAPAMATSHKSKKMAVLAIAVVLLVLVVVGGVAAAFYQVANRPQNVLDTALQNTFSGTKAASADFEGSLDIKPKGSQTISTSFTGSADSKTGAFTLSAKFDALVATINLDMRSTDGTTLYLRLSGLDGLASLLSGGSGIPASVAEFSPLVSAVNNQWISVNPGMVKQLTGTDTDLSAKLSDADRQKLATAYKDHQFLVAGKSLPDEAIKGKQSKHYQVTIDKAALKAFVGVVASEHIGGIKSSADNLASFNKSVDGIDTAKYPLDVWISKGDKMIDQVSFTATANGTTVTLRLTVDDYNKPVQVTAPAGAKSILDLLSSLLASPTAGAGLDALSSGGISL